MSAALAGAAPPPVPEAAALTAAERGRLADALRRQIRQMDLGALFNALQALGYSGDRVELRSNPTSTHTASLFSAIELSPERARVTMNLGLMSNQGPLPSYFTELLADQRDNALSELLWFFDQYLLRHRALALMPEEDEETLPRFSETRRQLLRLLRLQAPCALHWLFQRVFPEMEVLTRRRLAARPLRTSGALLGDCRLGDSSTLGGLAEVPVPTLEVRLCTDEWEAPGRLPWAHAAPARLRARVAPLLSDLDLPLVVVLVVREREGHARLLPGNLLGYDPIRRGPEPGPRRRAQRVELWRSSGASEPGAPMA